MIMTMMMMMMADGGSRIADRGSDDEEKMPDGVRAYISEFSYSFTLLKYTF